MSDDILKEIERIFEITDDTFYEFKEIYGLTFVFKTRIVTFKNRIPSAEIKPVGIIYKENDEFYFAPLYRSYELTEIVKEYVKYEKKVKGNY